MADASASVTGSAAADPDTQLAHTITTATSLDCDNIGISPAEDGSCGRGRDVPGRGNAAAPAHTKVRIKRRAIISPARSRGVPTIPFSFLRQEPNALPGTTQRV